MRKEISNQFVMIPYCLGFDIELNPIDVRVYFALRSYRNEKTKHMVFPSRAALASRIGCHVATIDRAIKSLERAGYISHIRGQKGRANSYQFRDSEKLRDSSVGAAMVALSAQADSSTRVASVAAPVRSQSESYNQKNEPESPLRLFHHNDVASVMANGDVRIRIHTGAWLPYGGGDDDGFRFGNLKGSTALKAAIARYSKH